MSQIRASCGAAASTPTAFMKPSRMIMLPWSRTWPGLMMTFPPTKACVPGGKGRKPGGNNSSDNAGALMSKYIQRADKPAKENRILFIMDYEDCNGRPGKQA